MKIAPLSDILIHGRHAPAHEWLELADEKLAASLLVQGLVRKHVEHSGPALPAPVIETAESAPVAEQAVASTARKPRAK